MVQNINDPLCQPDPCCPPEPNCPVPPSPLGDFTDPVNPTDVTPNNFTPPPGNPLIVPTEDDSTPSINAEPPPGAPPVSPPPTGGGDPEIVVVTVDEPPTVTPPPAEPPVSPPVSPPPPEPPVGDPPPGNPVVHGDPHFMLFNYFTNTDGELDIKKSPLNVDDNISATGIIWYAIKLTSGATGYIYYECAPYPAVANGWVVNKLIVSSPQGTDTYEYDSGSGQLEKNGSPWSGPDTFVFMDKVLVRVSGTFFDSSNPCSGGADIGYIEMSVAPCKSWVSSSISKMGGAYYYILKEAYLRGAGPHNTFSAGGEDGITKFCSVNCGKTRASFEMSSPAGTCWETYDQVTMKGIMLKYHELLNITGNVNMDWDQLVGPGCFYVSAFTDDSASEFGW